jgi:hypothetical protein
MTTTPDHKRRVLRHLQAETRRGKTMQFLIWSNEHGAWCGPGGMSYVHRVAGAGRYDRGEAFEICRNALPGQWSPGRPFPEVPIAEADAIELDTAGRLMARKTRSSGG